ncbi:MAG: signal peptidase I [Chloroflexi bacterium]|nr:signal peptidase I [Chloroflexota bacterium]
MTPQSHPAPDEPPEDVFGDPARSLAVPHPDWQRDSPASATAFNARDAGPSDGSIEAPVPRLAAGDIPGADGGGDSWRTPPADFLLTGDPAIETQFSHLGLTTIDPWAPVTPWYHAIWPWGWGGVIETLDVLVLALVMFMGVRFTAHNYIVDGASMFPTFEDSDFLIVNRMAYRSFYFSWVPGVETEDWRPFGEPQPGDVIVFHFQPSSSERDFIKRVVAVPGQTVHVAGGSVYVDNARLDEPYIAQAPNYEFPPTLVEPGTVFVLGDNRNNSYDSHAFGPVEQSTIVGRADFRYWPATRWGLVDHVIGNGPQLATRALGGMASLWP